MGSTLLAILAGLLGVGAVVLAATMPLSQRRPTSEEARDGGTGLLTFVSKERAGADRRRTADRFSGHGLSRQEGLQAALDADEEITAENV